MKRTIEISKINLSNTYSVKDNSPRGCRTVSGRELKIGDEVVIDNYFTEIIPDEVTEEIPEEKRTSEDIKANIIEFFRENGDIFNTCIEELDSYNGYLGDNRYYGMDMLSDFYSGTDPIELLNRAYFGYDAESWHLDKYGEKHYEAFNPNRDYFSYNGYGNLVSSDYKDYSAYLDNYAIEAMLENRSDIYEIDSNEELSKLFDELENATEV